MLIAHWEVFVSYAGKDIRMASGGINACAFRKHRTTNIILLGLVCVCVRACITTKNKQTPFYGAAIGNAMLTSKLLVYLYLPTKSTV